MWRFWYTPPDKLTLLARMLIPFGWLYEIGTAWRLRRGSGVKTAIPVICVGNLNVGGTGKTPAVIALVQLLQQNGCRPVVVSRGYGGTTKEPLRVDTLQHDAKTVGDEALLLAAFAPVWVGQDRASVAQKAGTDGDVIVMDDGFQNDDVVKDLSIVVVDACRGFGNGHCLPAGPLREPVSVGLSRADLLVVIGSSENQVNFQTQWAEQTENIPVMQAQLIPLQTGMEWQNMPVLAFAGIGDPQKFFRTLRDLGADIRKEISLTDHQALPDALLKRLEADAKLSGAQLVTTEKDAVRLPRRFQQKILTVPVRLYFSDEKHILSVLKEKMCVRTCCAELDSANTL